MHCHGALSTFLPAQELAGSLQAMAADPSSSLRAGQYMRWLRCISRVEDPVAQTSSAPSASPAAAAQPTCPKSRGDDVVPNDCKNSNGEETSYARARDELEALVLSKEATSQDELEKNELDIVVGLETCDKRASQIEQLACQLVQQVALRAHQVSACMCCVVAASVRHTCESWPWHERQVQQLQLDKKTVERDLKNVELELELRDRQVNALGADKHEAQEVLQVVREQVLELRAMWTRQVEDNEHMQTRLASTLRITGLHGCMIEQERERESAREIDRREKGGGGGGKSGGEICMMEQKGGASV